MIPITERMRELVKEYTWPKAVAVTGALGSGKTEWVLNLAYGLFGDGEDVTVADMDIINPYFCVRQVKNALEKEGLSIITPPENTKWSDIPVISPAVGRALASEEGKLLIDVGGDASGVRALKQVSDLIERAGYLLVLVVNAFRPKTSDKEGIAEMIRRMEEISSLKVGAIVGNSHLMSETTEDDFFRGLEVTREAADATGLPLLYATVPPGLHERIGILEEKAGVPLWPLQRRMLLPWEKGYNWT
ncbi:MAG: hypothetical protein ACLFN0_04545 [Thermovirgaceae bacterium]